MYDSYVILRDKYIKGTKARVPRQEVTLYDSYVILRDKNDTDIGYTEIGQS